MKAKLLFLLVLLLPISLSAQTPTWKRHFISKGSPHGMAFADSNTGFVVVNIPSTSIQHAFTTHDHSSSYTECDSFPLFFGIPSAPNSQFLSWCYYQNGSEITTSTTDSGRSWNSTQSTEQFRANPHQIFPIPSTSPDSILQFMWLMDGEYLFALSTDQGKTFSEMGTDLQGIGRWGTASSNLQTLFAGIEEPSSGFPWKLARSNDGGTTWSYTFPIDSSSITYRFGNSITEPLIYFQGIIPGFDPKHYYMMGGRLDSSLDYIDDYLYSSDSGVTWQEDSNVARGRVESISNPTANFLAAMVYHALNLKHSYADSIFYSTDNGNSWQKDGTTFQQDSIYYMQWFNATNGYVLTYRDSSTWLYHYSVGVDTVADTASHDTTSIVSNSEAPASTISAFPDPTKDYVHVTIPISDPITEMHIYDVMEREVHPSTDYSIGELTIDARNLAAGSYFAQISGRSGYKYLVRFSRQP